MRAVFDDQLHSLRQELVALAGQVRLAVVGATDALLGADADLADRVVRGDGQIDAKRESLHQRCMELLSLQNPVAGDLRLLVASLRMAQELERMGDHAGHVAELARRRAPECAVPADLVPSTTRMASIAETMIRHLEHVIAHVDVRAARELDRIDDEMDRLHRETLRRLLGAHWPHGVEPAVDLALLGRHYERIADHAVTVAGQVVFLATGDQGVAASH